MSIVTPVEVELQLFGEMHWVPRTAWSPFFLRLGFTGCRRLGGVKENWVKHLLETCEDAEDFLEVFPESSHSNVFVNDFCKESKNSLRGLSSSTSLGLSGPWNSSHSATSTSRRRRPIISRSRYVKALLFEAQCWTESALPAFCHRCCVPTISTWRRGMRRCKRSTVADLRPSDLPCTLCFDP